MPIERADRHEMVAVDDAARLVDRDEAIGVAVEGQTDIGPVGYHRIGEHGGVECPGSVVDVRAGRRVVQHAH